ncbi:SAF domain-containing protein [Prauserella muralis]|uniref:Uncharacterized protein n=1 Tax=Prauserella muralis TaxID=588067 RepID=A0A2V4B6E3_9PSEU|nr:SAF domain-containing protein [Prauserella muralis]PXY30874.1 hypothetical protein BAY60_00040 [Prauserella muralis]TWE14885.1 Flp pilus assembly protein CpaB [Prauserella muralis]
MNDSPRRHRGQHRFLPLRRGHPATLARRALAVVLLLAAAVLAAHPAAAGGEPRAPALAATRDLPLGATLTRSDVKIIQVPRSLRPAGALTDPTAVEGRTLAGLARTGELLSDARLLGPRSAPPGTTTVPVRLADPGVARLLHAGTEVHVVTLDAAEQGDQVLGGAATVLTVVDGAPAARAGPASGDEGPLVLLAVPADDAATLAAVSLAQPLTVTLR